MFVQPFPKLRLKAKSVPLLQLLCTTNDSSENDQQTPNFKTFSEAKEGAKYEELFIKTLYFAGQFCSARCYCGVNHSWWLALREISP